MRREPFEFTWEHSFIISRGLLLRLTNDHLHFAVRVETELWRVSLYIKKASCIVAASFAEGVFGGGWCGGDEWCIGRIILEDWITYASW